VKQRAVHDRAEPAVIATEVADVSDLECDVAQTASGRVGAGRIDGGRRCIQSDCGVTQFGQPRGGDAFPAARIEDLAVNLALFDQGGDVGLRLADTPRWLSAQTQPGTLAPVSGPEGELGHIGFSHAPMNIKAPEICQNV
jgi:hypothetical protein